MIRYRVNQFKGIQNSPNSDNMKKCLIFHEVQSTSKIINRMSTSSQIDIILIHYINYEINRTNFVKVKWFSRNKKRKNHENFLERKHLPKRDIYLCNLLSIISCQKNMKKLKHDNGTTISNHLYSFKTFIERYIFFCLDSM